MITTVLFHFITPTGVPIANADVVIQLARSEYDDTDPGVVLPREIIVVTDAHGKATADLIASDATYHVSVQDPVSEAGLAYRFIVPESPTPLRLQDIIVKGEFGPLPLEEATLLAINKAKIEARSYMQGALRARTDVQALINNIDSGGLVASVNGINAEVGNVVLTSQNIPENGNLYFTGVRAITAVNTLKNISNGIAALDGFKLTFRNSGNTVTSTLQNSNTAARSYTFPDKDGVIALLTDIPTGGSNVGIDLTTLAAVPLQTLVNAPTSYVLFADGADVLRMGCTTTAQLPVAIPLQNSDVVIIKQSDGLEHQVTLGALRVFLAQA